jgi:hypothetical protein
VVHIDAGETPTFGVFIKATGNVPFLPGVNRVSVLFASPQGIVVGATSVAIRTQ